MRRAAKYFIFLAIAVGLPFIVLNEAVRWTWERSYPFKKFIVIDWELFDALRPGFQGQLPVNLFRTPHWRGKSAFWKLTVDQQGVRESPPVIADRSAAPPFRIICLGDSNTFGLAVDDQYSYPAQLSQVLNNELGGRAEVINAGVPGYSSRQGLVYLQERLLKYRPNLVIVGFGKNDAASKFIHGFRRDNTYLKGNVTNGWKKIYDSPLNVLLLHLGRQPLVTFSFYISNAVKIALAVQMAHELQKSGKVLENPPPGKSLNTAIARSKWSRVPPGDFLENLDQLVILSRQHGFRLVFYIPYKTPDDYRLLVLDQAAKNHIAVADFSRKLGEYRFDDLLANPRYAALLQDYRQKLGDQFLRQNPEFALTSDSSHANAAGCRIIAEGMARAIVNDLRQTPPPLKP
jgi:lysophospholipase L1-like esterase